MKKILKKLLSYLYIRIIYELYSIIILWLENILDLDYQQILNKYCDYQVAWDCRKYRPIECGLSKKEWLKKNKAQKIARNSYMYNCKHYRGHART